MLLYWYIKNFYLAKEGTFMEQKQEFLGDFVHLHVHTEYSLLDGSGKVSKIIAKAKELGMKSLAITDHGNMYGAIELYKEAHKAGIKPIIGVEAYIAERGRKDKEPGVDNKRCYTI